MILEVSFGNYLNFSAIELLKTEMSGYYGKFIIKDTVWDSAMNFFGVVAGILNFIFIKKHGVDRLF